MNVRASRNSLARAVEWEFGHSTYAAVLAEVPAPLFRYWSETAHHEFPGIPRDAAFYAQSVEGLMMFFDCVSGAGRPCALPSRAADSVWHAWARMDAPGLERFCIRHFGCAIPHLERARMGGMGRALAACLVQARRRASRPVAGPSLPRLFSLDWRLGMPCGFGYRIIGAQLACSTLDKLGNPDTEVSFPSELAPHGMLQAGLISQAEYDEGVRLGGLRHLRHLRFAGAWNDAGNVAVPDGDGADGDGAASCGGAASCAGSWGGGDCGS